MLSKQFKNFSRIATSRQCVYKFNRNLKFFTKNSKEEAYDTLKFDDALVESLKNPNQELVKPGKEKLVGGWLLLTAGAVFCMVVVGGYTRLSKSGLSMTRWKPAGYRYPSSEEHWQDEFEDYKKYPEYTLSNKDMSVGQFKRIFFVEFFHRLLGNAIGVIFGLPLGYFLLRGYLKPRLRNRCLGLLALGGTQGLIGWWMVKSGLNPKPEYQTRPRVSTYRLFVHLNTAIAIYGILFWNALTLLRKPQERILKESMLSCTMSARVKMIAILHFVAFNIITGVTVAGIDAGKVFNTWPDMNGAIVPANYLIKEPKWRNFFENTGTVQFNHRMFAYTTYLAVFYLFIKSRKMTLSPAAKNSILMLFIVVNFQLYNGIMMLMQMVPVESGVIHQTNALMVVSSALYCLHTLRKPNPKFIYYLKHCLKQPNSI